jgi:hypothetical protein
MQVRYGNTLLPANSTDVTTVITATLGRYGNPITYVHTVNLTGCLEGDTQAECATAEAAVRAAFAVPYRDLALLLDSGAVSPTYLRNNTSISGVRLLALSFPNNYGGAEYATLRSFQATFSAEYLANIDDPLVDYTEVVTVTGNGGPRTVVRECVNADPVEQEVSKKTPIRATQTGRAVGLLSYPEPARPLWPATLINPDAAVTKETPRPNGRGNLLFATAWSYAYVSPVRLVGGNPKLPPKLV